LQPALLRKAHKRELEPGRYHDGGGLYLTIQPTGAAAWMFRYMRSGKAHAMGLGRLADVSAPIARDLAAQHRRALALGADPLVDRAVTRNAQEAEARRQANGLVTFRGVAERVLAELDKSSFQKNTKQAWRSSLRDHVYPKLGNLPIDKVDR